MSLVDWIGMGLLGGVGALLRFHVDARIERGLLGAFPLGTLAVNVIGSFALGLLTGLHAAPAILFVAGTGLIGSFTTFSTWMFETHRLLEDGEAAVAGANVAVSLVAGLAAAGAGWGLGALL